MVYYVNGTIIKEGDLCVDLKYKSFVDIYYVQKVNEDSFILSSLAHEDRFQNMKEYCRKLPHNLGYKTDILMPFSRKEDWQRYLKDLYNKVNKKELIENLKTASEGLEQEIINIWTS